MNFGAALVGTGQHQLAAVRYRQALDYAPNDEIATGQVAQVEFNCGNIEEAERLARRLVENNPDVAVGWAVLIRAANVDPEQVPDSLREHPAVLMARGLVALRAGKPPDAVDAFRRALQHGSRDPQVLVLLAEALTLASRDERSLKNE